MTPDDHQRADEAALQARIEAEESRLPDPPPRPPVVDVVKPACPSCGSPSYAHVRTGAVSDAVTVRRRRCRVCRTTYDVRWWLDGCPDWAAEDSEKV